MAVTHQRVSVGITATKLTLDADGKDGQTLNVQNPTGGVSVYLGGAGVTTTSYGYLLSAGADFSIELDDDEKLFAVVAASTQTVNIIRQGSV
jgi:hypothetical protein